MAIPVLFERSVQSERPFAYLALVGFLSRVNPRVLLHVPQSRKGSLAMLAFVGTFARMSSHVSEQTFLPPESSRTNLANVIFWPPVNLLVSVHFTDCAEPHSANVAEKVFLSLVPDFMKFQTVFRSETFSAQIAQVILLLKMNRVLVRL